MQTWQDKNSPLYAGLPFMKIRGQYISYPCAAELKMDGEFNYLINSEGKNYLANKREHGRVRTDTPVTNITIPTDSVFIGELIWDDGKDFYEFLRHKLSDELKFVVFGVLRFEGVDIWQVATYLEQRKILEKQRFYNGTISLVPNFQIQTAQDLNNCFKNVCSNGYEGIVVKDIHSHYANGETGRWIKQKAKLDADLVVLGFQTGTKRAKTLSLRLGHKVNGGFEYISHCGGGLKHDEKEALLKALKPHVIGKQKDDYLVTPKLVVRVGYNRVIKNSDGTVNSIRNAVFEGFRLDKSLEEVDTIIG